MIVGLALVSETESSGRVECRLSYVGVWCRHEESIDALERRREL